MNESWANELSFNFTRGATTSISTLQEQRPSGRQIAEFRDIIEVPVSQGAESPLFEPAYDEPSQQTEVDFFPETTVRCVTPAASRQVYAESHAAQRASDQRHSEKTPSNSTKTRVMNVSDQRSIMSAGLRRSTVTPSSQRDEPHETGLSHQLYRDAKGVLREIWQPGDPDGQRDGEFPDRSAFTSRLRFFQSSIDKVERDGPLPPKYVILDDKAVYDILESKVFTQKDKGQYWPFDFAKNGRLRSGRPKRGRAALVDGEEGEKVDLDDGQGERNVGWTMEGDKGHEKIYHLTGERKGYTEVKFDTAMMAKSQVADTPTPADKSGTEPKSKREAENHQPLSHRHKRPKVDKSMHSTPSPHWLKRTLPPALAEPNVSRNEDARDQLTPSPYTMAGGRTVYAGMTNIMDEEDSFPQRIGGRVVASGLAMGAQTPHPASGDEDEFGHVSGPSSLWQAVKMMENELRHTAKVLNMRNKEVNVLKAEARVRDRLGVEMLARDAEIAQLKSENMHLRRQILDQQG